MALSSGARVGAYEVVELIGKGGMGEVYRARDTKLGRDVAIKALPEEFARNPERVSRFEREARLLASLNHPNIATIYGIEESEGARFLILELVEGETLAECVERGAVPQEEAIALALQVADALDAAHEKDVIHRDLKPANIKITPNGVVKVLDFGLAKVLGAEESSVAASNSPTVSIAATQQGIILGTAAYMSPEQAKGRPAGRSSDIWAFGCVLYEMLVGRPAFSGDDLSEILASVIKATTDLNLVPSGVHPRVRRTLSRYLEKDVKKRFRDIGDARNELAEALANDSSAETASNTPARRHSRKTFALVGLAALAGGVILSSIVWWRLGPSSPPLPVTRFDDSWPLETQAVRGINNRALAVSPDGRFVVYNTSLGFYVRDLNTNTWRLISGTGDHFPRTFDFSGRGMDRLPRGRPAQENLR